MDGVSKHHETSSITQFTVHESAVKFEKYLNSGIRIIFSSSMYLHASKNSHISSETIISRFFYSIKGCFDSNFKI